MRQQVNLHQPERLPSPPRLSARLLLLVLVAAAAGLLLAGGILLGQTGLLRERLAGLEREQEAQVALLEELRESYPPPRKDPRLEEDLHRLEQERARKASIWQLLASGEMGNARGFSPVLEALARQDLPGTWLRRVDLSAGGREVLLLGSALEPELAPRLLQRLGGEEAFAGAEFHRLELTRITTGERSRIDFLLATFEEEGRKAGP